MWSRMSTRYYLEALRRGIIEPENGTVAVLETVESGDVWWHLDPGSSHTTDGGLLRTVPVATLISEFDDEDLDGAYTGTAYVCTKCHAMQADAKDFIDDQITSLLAWLRGARLTRTNLALDGTDAPSRRRVEEALAATGLLLAMAPAHAPLPDDLTSQVRDELPELCRIYQAAHRAPRDLAEVSGAADETWAWASVRWNLPRAPYDHLPVRAALAAAFAAVPVDQLPAVAFLSPRDPEVLVFRVPPGETERLSRTPSVHPLPGSTGILTSEEVAAALRLSDPGSPETWEPFLAAVSASHT